MADTTNTPTAKSGTTSAKRSAAAKKGAATRKRTTTRSASRGTASRSTARKSPTTTTGRRTRTTAQNKTRDAAKANATAAKTTAKQGRNVAERAGLVYVGAVLEARDRVTTVATDVVETLTTRRGVTLRRLERRGETETRKARTRARARHPPRRASLRPRASTPSSVRPSVARTS